MSESEEWDRWLVSEDSDNVLGPTGFDYQVALVRVNALHLRLIRAFVAYEVSTVSPLMYQDSTGMTSYRVSPKGDRRPFASPLALIVLSHFGELATVKDCQDPELLTRIRDILQDSGLKYIPYDYIVSKTYNGKCKALIGFSWANRYFSLATRLNDGSGGDGTWPEDGTTTGSSTLFVVKRGDPFISTEIAAWLARRVIKEKYSKDLFATHAPAQIADNGESWSVTFANGLVDAADRSPTPLVNGKPVARNLTIAIRKATGEVISIS